MIKFVTTGTYRFIHLLMELLVWTVIIVLLYLLLLLFVPERFSVFSIIVPLIAVLIDLYSKASRKRLLQLVFDTDNRVIIFFHKSLLSDIRHRRLSFDDAAIEMVVAKPGLLLAEPVTLYFLKGKTEVFEVTKSKDGFTADTLREMVQTAESHSIPITKIQE